MKCASRFGRVVRVWDSAAALKLAAKLRRAAAWNKRALERCSQSECEAVTISAAMGPVNIVRPDSMIKRGARAEAQLDFVSFKAALSGVVYDVRLRAEMSTELTAAVPFYTLGPAGSALLRSFASKHVPKTVYRNGIDIAFNFRRYFGQRLENVYDVRHLLNVYSAVDKSIGPGVYSELVRSYLEHRRSAGRREGGLLAEHCSPPSHGEAGDDTPIDMELHLNQNAVENIVPLSSLVRFREFLYHRYKISNHTFNLKMENVFEEVSNRPKIYKVVHRPDLEMESLNHKMLENKILEELLERGRQAVLETTKGPFYGIVLERIEAERRVLLNINSFVVDEPTREALPVYGIADADSFKFFDDKKIGDVVECEERITCIEGRNCVNIKRMQQESLIYSLRNKRYVPMHDIMGQKPAKSPAKKQV